MTATTVAPRPTVQPDPRLRETATALPDGEYSTTVRTGPSTCAAHVVTVQAGHITEVSFDGQQIPPSSTCFGAYAWRAARAIEAAR